MMNNFLLTFKIERMVPLAAHKSWLLSLTTFGNPRSADRSQQYGTVINVTYVSQKRSAS